MSGMTKTPLSVRTSSAPEVVGPLAPSARMRHLTRSTLREVMTFSVAAGMRISHSVVSNSAGSDASAPGKPCTVPFFWRNSTRAFKSIPALLYRPPPTSAMPTTLYPPWCISWAAFEPTLPKPCTITRLLSRDRPSFLMASSHTPSTPRPVASRRPREPPMLMGFPVTHAVTVCRMCMEYVSIIQAMICSLVLTSGAGTSFSGPRSGAADVDGLSGDARRHGLPHVHGVCVHHPGHDLFVGIDIRRGNVFFGSDEFDQFGGVAPGHALDFAHGHFVGIADHAALGAAERNVDHGALPGHPTGEGADLIERD